MPRKINLGDLKKNSSLPVEEVQEETIQVENKVEKNIEETIELLLKTNNRILNYSVKEASQALNISEEFLRRRITNEKIKTITMGDRKMITVFEIARILCEGVE